MAKKKSWGIDVKKTADAAKDAIKTTSHSAIPTTPTSTPKQKKKPGPKGQDEDITRVQILESSHKKLKTLAAHAEKKQLEYLSELVDREYEKLFK